MFISTPCGGALAFPPTVHAVVMSGLVAVAALTVIVAIQLWVLRRGGNQ